MWVCTPDVLFREWEKTFLCKIDLFMCTASQKVKNLILWNFKKWLKILHTWKSLSNQRSNRCESFMDTAFFFSCLRTRSLWKSRKKRKCARRESNHLGWVSQNTQVESGVNLHRKQNYNTKETRTQKFGVRTQHFPKTLDSECALWFESMIIFDCWTNLRNVKNEITFCKSTLP